MFVCVLTLKVVFCSVELDRKRGIVVFQTMFMHLKVFSVYVLAFTNAFSFHSPLLYLPNCTFVFSVYVFVPTFANLSLFVSPCSST
jgi:hypothetical protein